MATIAGLLSYILLTQKGTEKTVSEESRYTAVFLTSGQVYFGWMSEEGSMVVLSNVYYVSTAKDAEKTPAESLSLIHLGNEVYGPTDEMRINPEHILFTETLRSDSQVVKAMTAGGTAADQNPLP
jgi:hypothetical protein